MANVSPLVATAATEETATTAVAASINESVEMTDATASSEMSSMPLSNNNASTLIPSLTTAKATPTLASIFADNAEATKTNLWASATSGSTSTGFKGFAAFSSSGSMSFAKLTSKDDSTSIPYDSVAVSSDDIKKSDTNVSSICPIKAFGGVGAAPVFKSNGNTEDTDTVKTTEENDKDVNLNESAELKAEGEASVEGTATATATTSCIATTGKRKFEEVSVKTGEEDETVESEYTASLHFFNTAEKSWKGRGQGRVKILVSNKAAAIGDSGDLIRRARIVVRAKGTHALLLNARVWDGMEADRASPKAVRINACDADKLQIFLITLTKIEEADEFVHIVMGHVRKLKEAHTGNEKKEFSENTVATSTSAENAGDDSAVLVPAADVTTTVASDTKEAVLDGDDSAVLVPTGAVASDTNLDGDETTNT